MLNKSSGYFDMKIFAINLPNFWLNGVSNPNLHVGLDHDISMFIGTFEFYTYIFNGFLLIGLASIS